MAKAMSMSNATMKRAKADLKKEGRLKYRSEGWGQDKKFYASLIATEKMS